MKMNKNFKSYAVAWAIMLVLFNVIAFVSIGWSGYEKYTASFWIGYVVITIAFFGQLACAYIALKEENLQKAFYNLSLITTSYTGLVLTLIFGGLCMIVSPLPYWAGAIICSVVLAFSAVAVVKASVAIDAVSQVDEKIRVQTLFIKSLIIDAQTLLTKAQSDEAKAECKKVYEAIRYSDPMNNTALSSLENDITIRFAAFSDAVKEDNVESVKNVASELVILIEERNKKCKLLK